MLKVAKNSMLFGILKDLGDYSKTLDFLGEAKFGKVLGQLLSSGAQETSAYIEV